MPIKIYQVRLPVESGVALRYLERPSGQRRMTPAWMRMENVPETEAGSDGPTRFAMKLGPFRLSWSVCMEKDASGLRFKASQSGGPFLNWMQTSTIVPENERSTLLKEKLEYRFQQHRLSSRLVGGAMERRMNALFRHRHQTMRSDLQRHMQLESVKPSVIAVTGASGLVGAGLCAFLGSGGHTVLKLVRNGRPKESGGEIYWDPAKNEIDAASLEGVDAAVHLAGENIGAGRWTAERKRAIRESRVNGTELVARTLARLSRPPRSFVSASAIGWYGSRDAEPADERAPAGKGFLPELCQAWEAAAQPARDAGIRTVHPRIGVVLSARGGALAKMAPPFRVGLGGPIGSGKQILSWIHIDDLIGALHWMIFNDVMDGPVNAVAPGPVSNGRFARRLAKTLGRPAFFPLPAAAVKLAFGEMGERLLLEGAFVQPARLLDSGFRFQFPQLAEALDVELG